MKKRIFLFVFIVLACVTQINAQNLLVKKISTLPNDNSAIVNPRLDANSDTCALVKVGAGDIEGFLFKGAVNQNAELQGGYYNVYVPRGTKRIFYQVEGFLPGEINFSDAGIKITGGVTYKVELETPEKLNKKTQTVVFMTSPKSVNVEIAGKQYNTNNGILHIECEMGTVSYIVSQDLYHQQEGAIVADDSEEAKIIPIVLDHKTTDVEFMCDSKDAKLIVDNKDLGGVGNKNVETGKRKVRVVAPGFQDYCAEINFQEGKKRIISPKLRVKNYLNPVVVNTNVVSGSLYIDNKEVSGWTPGKEIMVKKGKHLLRLESSFHKPKEVVIKVFPGMPALFYSLKKKS